jgi:ABC-2 type transport system ATP-binding protein
MTNTAVVVDNIRKSYGKNVALDAIGFSVEKGEIFGFIGPDGAGKTTLFRLITTLLIPDSGEIMVFGHDTVKEYKQIRKNIGYMPGKFSLYQDLSVEENLNFYATAFGTTVQENYELIKDIYRHIEPFKKRLAGKLSGGMKQKLALSCALIHKPDLLVLDEPTTGVDAVSRKEFWEMLHKLKLSGITVIVSTPYMDEAILCDRVALIQKGKIMAIDVPEKITTLFKKRLYSISASPMNQVLKKIRTLKNIHSAYLFGQNIHVSFVEENVDISEVQSFLEKEEFLNIEIKSINPGIEDCFMELMDTNQ